MPQTLIRQIPDDYADSIGLGKYNRSRLPGCRDRFSAALNQDGRYITGIDEDSYLVPVEKRAKIKDMRESLEKLTGKDLSGTSKFWETFMVTIESDRPKIFNSENPIDVIGLTMLIANSNVAPSKDDISNPKYRDAQYYAYTEDGEVKEEVSARKKRDTAIAELIKIQDSKDKLLLYGQYLEGLKYQSVFGEDTLYKMLRAYIEDKEIKNSERFLEAIKKPVDELQTKIIIDRAFKQRLIVKTRVANGKYVHQFGNVTLGGTVEDVYRNLSLPEYASELLAIQSDIAKK